MRVLDVIKPLYEAANDPTLTASNAIHSANLLSSITDKIPEEDGIKLVKFNDYLETVDETNRTAKDTTDAQNFYCINQKQNPHTPRVMVSLGLSEDDVTHFIQDCLFPEIR